MIEQRRLRFGVNAIDDLVHRILTTKGIGGGRPWSFPTERSWLRRPEQAGLARSRAARDFLRRPGVGADLVGCSTTSADPLISKLSSSSAPLASPSSSRPPARVRDTASPLPLVTPTGADTRRSTASLFGSTVTTREFRPGLPSMPRRVDLSAGCPCPAGAAHFYGAVSAPHHRRALGRSTVIQTPATADGLPRAIHRRARHGDELRWRPAASSQGGN